MKKSFKKSFIVAVAALGMAMTSGCASVMGGGGPHPVSIQAGFEAGGNVGISGVLLHSSGHFVPRGKKTIKAKYAIVQTRTGLVIKQGITPDTVILKSSAGGLKKAKYRVEVTHPDTGKVYSEKLFAKSKFTSVAGNAALLFPLIFPSFIGYMVDAGTGAMWNFPDSVVVAFDKKIDGIELPTGWKFE